MGNTSYSATEYDEKVRKAEFDLLLCANIPLEYIQRRNIQFKYGEKDGQWDWVNIRTIIINDKDEFDEFATDKPTLVMIHGFGASGVMFFPILKGLLEHYKIVLIDILGFAGSSKVSLSERTTTN